MSVRPGTTQAVDARWNGRAGPVLIEVRKTNSVRDVRDALTSLVFALREEPPEAEAVCVVVSTRLSEQRIRHEVSMFRDIVHPLFAGRVRYLVAGESDTFHGDYESEEAAFWRFLHEVVERETKPPMRAALPPRQAVISAFVTDLLAGRSRPRTVKDWQRAAEVSYPTAVAAVSDLIRKGLIEDTKERGVRMRALTAGELIELARDHASKRRIKLYADPTGMATPKRLIDRLFKLQAAGTIEHSVRVGGVLGATHHYPPLDITSAPRLDLSTVHDDLDVTQIDAALAELRDDEPRSRAILAVHGTVDPWASLTRDPAVPSPWASSFECLADLVEMGYAREAGEMVAAIIH